MMTSNSIMDRERLIRINISLERIADELEKSNELKQKELELQQYYADFEIKKYQDKLRIQRIEKGG